MCRAAKVENRTNFDSVARGRAARVASGVSAPLCVDYVHVSSVGETSIALDVLRVWYVR